MQAQTRKVLSATLTTTVVTGLAALWSLGVRVRPSAIDVALCCCAMTWLNLSFRDRLDSKLMQTVFVFGDGLVILSGISLCGALLSYWVMRVTPFAFADVLLRRADLAIGLDWLALFNQYRTMPGLYLPLRICYLTIFKSPILIVFGLSLTGQKHRQGQFLAAFAIALGMTIIVSAFLPAITPIGLMLNGAPKYFPATGLDYIAEIKALHSSRLMDLKLGSLLGILTFPSFHAASAVIFAWAGWTIRVYRWPLIIVNAGMIVSTPLEGSHYFVDVFAGMLVGLCAIYATRAFSLATVLKCASGLTIKNAELRLRTGKFRIAG